MIRAASIGLGWWGKVLANSIRGSDKIKVVAATTRTLSNIEDYCREIGARVAADYDAVLADRDIDAVILATPHSTHRRQIEQAAAAGKHVFVEKPIALTPVEARASFDAAAAAGIQLAVGFNRRFHPNYRRLREAVAGKVGRIVHIEASMSASGVWNYAPDSWRSTREETPAGGMTGLGIHVVDQMIDIAGPMTSVAAQAVKPLGIGPLDEVTSAIMAFESGPTASLMTSIATCFYYNFRVFGENGCAEIRERDLSEFVFQPRDGEAERHHEAGFAMERAELEAFAEAVEGGAPYPVTADQAVQGVAVLDAIVRSAAENRIISL